MNISEKFQSENLFEKINEISPLPFKDTTYINMYWLNKYGERGILSQWEKTDIADIANTISVLFSDKWNTQYKYAFTDILSDGNKTETTTRIVNDTGTSNTVTDGSNNHSVSAFDSADMVNDNSDVEQRTVKADNSNDKKETVTSTAKTGNYINDLISYNKYLTNNHFFDMICIDVNSVFSYGTMSLNI